MDALLGHATKNKRAHTELVNSGFKDRGGKGSHRNFMHPKVAKPITISGALGDEAKHYQVRAVKQAVEESKS